MYFTEVNKLIIIMIRTYVKCLLYHKRFKFYAKIAKCALLKRFRIFKVNPVIGTGI